MFIPWLGIATNFSLFFCEFRSAGCLARREMDLSAPKKGGAFWLTFFHFFLLQNLVTRRQQIHFLARAKQPAGRNSQKNTEKLGATPKQRIKKRESGLVVVRAPFVKFPRRYQSNSLDDTNEIP